MIFKRVPYRGGLLLLTLHGQATAFISGGLVEVYDDIGHGLTLHASIRTTPELALGTARHHLRHRVLGTLGSPRSWVPER